MTHEGVESRRYDFLFGCEFDSCRGKGIFSVHKENDEKPNGNQNVSRHHYVEWHPGPCEAVIKRGHNKRRDESCRRDGLYDPLTRFLLGSRPAAEPPLQEFRVFFH